MAKLEKRRHIFVFAHWERMKDPMFMGTLHSELLRGSEIFSFDYDDIWLRSKHAHVLDPDLQLYSGVQYLNDDRTNFGIFLDSSPDRWGQVLLKRKEAALARIEQRPERHLFQTDYLLGVYDGHRMGALRFKSDMDGPFLNNDKKMATPPWSSIRELEEISLRLEDDNAMDDPEYMHWINTLIAPGSSLGGARPKASVVDNEQHLWIAKFPSQGDYDDKGGWEIVTHELALTAGVNMSTCQARKFSNHNHTFLTKRFDRKPTGERMHFASAMTLLGLIDGQDHNDGVSYLDLVEFLMRHGANVDSDLEELWRRIVFYICISNTDDHLRNHGFILTNAGWILSPAYDINPDESGTGLSLNISDSDNALDLDLALSVCAFFRLDIDRAKEIISEVTSAVKDWRTVAKKYGISKTQQELKSRAFASALL